MQKHNIPLLGISGDSGSGKTTLLTQVVACLTALDVRVAVIKHTHHDVQTDKPGKDSWRMTHAGAKQVMVASSERWALLTETPQPPSLDYLAQQFDAQLVDVILVEGFKHEAIPKLLVHRQAFAKPLPTIDDYVVALVTDYEVNNSQLPRLDINHIEQVVQFIQHWYQQFQAD